MKTIRHPKGGSNGCDKLTTSEARCAPVMSIEAASFQVEHEQYLAELARFDQAPEIAITSRGDFRLSHPVFIPLGWREGDWIRVVLEEDHMRLMRVG
ncbi:hypothetical protein [Geothrix sp. PMB-07]|uniref:hypothetical protein n=1 Tax=Geothrix sp. PMB-07 TaxID=3068640 RepID=UPI00274152B8|nr:hypothetical protein [Geothrix sp. PMB-07]WLT30070.1 hypothetical protein Q9293_10110 [Geothrix sp. PMB-07]